MNRQIPGYYYDEEKKKYFKIEKSHTAPCSAAWSADNVKRRKVEAATAKSERCRADLVKNHIKRSRVLREPLLGGFLDRQLGFGANLGTGLGVGSRDAAAVVDVPGAAWADALVDRGQAWFMPHFVTTQREPNLSCFWVGGDDEKTGLGVAYAPIGDEVLVGAYIPTDNNEEISFANAHSMAPLAGRRLTYMYPRVPRIMKDISSITYNKASRNLLVTSRQSTSTPGVLLQQPKLSEPDESDKPLWLLEEHQEFRWVFLPASANQLSVCNALPVPLSNPNNLTCTLATNRGILLVDGDGGVRKWDTGDHSMDVLAQDFHATNPSVLIAGTRAANVQLLDLRCPPNSLAQVEDDGFNGSLTFRHASAVTHVKALKGNNENHVLVAGLRSTMAVYDLRFVNKGEGDASNPSLGSRENTLGFSHQGGGKGRRARGREKAKKRAAGGGEGGWPAVPYPTNPILTFPSYCNEAHIQVGLDVYETADIVAAAHDNGTVGLYSLLSGRRLRSPVLDAVGRVGQPGPEPGLGVGASGVGTRGSTWYRGRSATTATSNIFNAGVGPPPKTPPIKSLMFQAMPHERHSSLWLGFGLSVKKFSVGRTEEGEQ